MKEFDFTISEIALKYNPKIPVLERAIIANSKDAYQQLMLLMNTEMMAIREEIAVLFLNRGNRVIGGAKLFAGGITSSIVDIRIILAIALKSLSTGIIIAHNHPSGELKPSKCDKELTEKLKEAGKLMDIKLLDHLILSTEGYFSFEDERLL